LVVAAGVGYGAAVLAACGVRVTALEADEALAAMARTALATAAPGVNLVLGPLAAGWPAEAPYDIVLIEGAVAVPPAAIVAQLRQEVGRLVTVVRGTAGPGRAVRGETTPAGLQMRPQFDCATPPIPDLLPAPVFAF
jgi:protein-L-isoaspartate(D-aspartate) O-methyltransferase